MRNSSPIAAFTNLDVVIIADNGKQAPIQERDQHEISRLLLHRLTVLEAALRRVEELRRGAALASQSTPLNDAIGTLDPPQLH